MTKRTMAVLVAAVRRGPWGRRLTLRCGSGTRLGMPGSVPGAPRRLPTAAVDSRGPRRRTDRTSLTGTHRWYAQTFRGLPVLDGYYAVHTARSTGAVSVADGRIAVPATVSTTPLVTAAAAVTTTSAGSGRSPGRPQPPCIRRRGPEDDGGAAHPGPRGHPVRPRRAERRAGVVRRRRRVGRVTCTLVDARTGTVRGVTVLSKAATGQGQIFTPNPSSRCATGDHRQERRQPGRARPGIPHRDAAQSLRHWHLVGTAVRIVAGQGSGDQPDQHLRLHPGRRPLPSRSWRTTGSTSRRPTCTLGFTDANNESQDVAVNTIADDNSSTTRPWTRSPTAEAGSTTPRTSRSSGTSTATPSRTPSSPVSAQPCRPGRSAGLRRLLGRDDVGPDQRRYVLPCVMDWDSTSHTTTVPHCIRRLDTTKTVADAVGEVHADGEIWSRALWDIHKALGRLKGQHDHHRVNLRVHPNTSFAAAATRSSPLRGPCMATPRPRR